MKIWKYIASKSKGRILSDRDIVKNWLVGNNKTSCNVENELLGIDLVDSDIYIECSNFKSCNECLEKYLDMEIKENEM